MPEIAARSDIEEICRICKCGFDEDANAIECEGCRLWQHRKCAGLTQGEFDILKRSNCKLIWLCDECRLGIKKKEMYEDHIANLANCIENNMDRMRQYMETIMVEKVREAVTEEIHKGTRLSVSSEAISQKKKDADSRKQEPQKEVRPETTEKRTPDTLYSEPCRKDNQTDGHVAEMPASPAETPNAENPSTSQETIETEAEEGGGEQESWTSVLGRKQKVGSNPPGERPLQGQRRYTKTQRGTAKQGMLKAAERNAWIYIGRLASETTTDDITQYIFQNGIDTVNECEMLNTRGNNKAFKLAVPFRYRERVLDPEFWPEEVVFRPFRIR